MAVVVVVIVVVVVAVAKRNKFSSWRHAWRRAQQRLRGLRISKYGLILKRWLGGRLDEREEVEQKKGGEVECFGIYTKLELTTSSWASCKISWVCENAEIKKEFFLMNLGPSIQHKQ